MPTLTVDPREGEWRERRAAIARFLNLAASTEEPTLDQPGLDRLVGEYRQGRRTFTVSVRDAGLVLDGLLWPRNRLSPVAPGVFEAESWPRLLTFCSTAKVSTRRSGRKRCLRPPWSRSIVEITGLSGPANAGRSA